MQILKSSEFKSARQATTPQLTVSLNGVLAINTGAMKLLGVGDKSIVIITRANDGTFYIGRADKAHESDGYLVRLNNGKSAVQFNAKSLSVEIITGYDLAVAKDKKTSVRLDIKPTDPVKFDGLTLYEIIN